MIDIKIVAGQGIDKSKWNLKREHLSQCPSTNIKDIIKVASSY